MTNKEKLGDDLCRYCPLVKKGVYGVPGGSVAGCEGSRCDEAYENYENLVSQELEPMANKEIQQVAPECDNKHWSIIEKPNE